MATYTHDEQEQIDDLKAWWQRWGSTITAGVVLAAVVIVGVQGWRWWSASKAENASTLYAAVAASVRKNDAPRARDAIAELEDRFAGTAYAPRAALLYAHMLHVAGDKAGARQQLQWALDHASEEALKAVARYRLAQAQIDERQYDQALATLDARHPEAFDGMYADLRGDALAAAGRKADARAAYQLAAAKLDPKSQYLGYVRVKLDAMGGPTTEAAGSAAVAGKSAPAASAPAAPPPTPPAASAPTAPATTPAPGTSSSTAPAPATPAPAKAPAGSHGGAK